MIDLVLAPLPPAFLEHLAAGIALNLWIACQALLLGLLAGAPLAFGCAMPGRWRLLPAAIIELLGAAPTFLVMFFLLNVMPHDIGLFGVTYRLSGVVAVVVSLLPYSVAYVAQNGREALLQWRRGQPTAALLLLPNLARAFFVLVMASSAGAAIGVTEGITVILHEAERLHSLPERLRLFGIGILVFAVLMQGGFALVGVLRRHLEERLAERGSSKQFFFEKKNQKTFIPLGPDLSGKAEPKG